MSDLRSRIADIQQAHHLRIDPNHPAYGYCMCGYNPHADEDDHWWVAHANHVADAVIAELGRRRCERCRRHYPLDQFPPPHEGSDVMRPFCTRCTDYIYWATA